MSPHSQTSRVLRFYWNHVRNHKHILVGTIFSVPLTVLINTFLPSLIVANLLSRLAQHHFSHSVWSSFGSALIAYALLSLAGIATWRLVDQFVFRLEGYVERELANQVFGHMLDETADFHANNFSGSLVSQTNKLLGGYIRIADTTIFQVGPMVSSLFFASVILGPRAPLFVVALVLFAVIFLLVAFRASKKVRSLSAIHASNESVQTGQLADAITNVMVIKSFAQGSYERHRYFAASEKTHQSLLSFMREQGKLFNIMGSLTRTISVIALLIAVISVVSFGANIGTVFLIISYTSSIVEQLFNFSNSSLRNYNRAVGDAFEMVEILGTKPSLKDPKRPEKARISRGRIEFQNVVFRHHGSDDAIFEDFALRIQPGEKIGLVGHSGSGKTTFTRLLLRFSDIDSGNIVIDGQDIARISQKDLHRHIAYVPQEPLLFHRSIAENIAYGQLGAKLKTIRHVAAQAHAAEFIDTLPKAYDTMVGERGVKLSGGQRQRIAIARAMLKNAPILVLDEATSALDSESEVLIQDALWKLMEGRTAIVIAHRLSTIQRMDRIIVLEHGKIVEQGTHKELIRLEGTYAKLWVHQSGGFIES